MRQQFVFLSLLSYCFNSEKDLGKREKLTITEPKEIRGGHGVQNTCRDGTGAHAGHGFRCEVRDQRRLRFGKRRLLNSFCGEYSDRRHSTTIAQCGGPNCLVTT